MNPSKILLKNGIKSILFENEEQFKQNIVQTLSIKLNDSINDTRSEVEKNLFNEEILTNKTPQIDYFVSFMEAFVPGKFIFQDGSVLNITEENVNDVKELFEQLNPQSREKMASEIFENAQTFLQHINFSKKVKNLL